jgi:TolB-like protein/tetratricopeptide (TPR) repeat protein
VLYFFEQFSLDSARRELRRGASLVSIEPKAFDFLVYTIRNRDRVVSRDDLIAAVWEGRIVSESALATCVNAARVAVDDRGDEQRLIKTFLRKGFRFVGDVREEESRGDSPIILAKPSRSILALPDKPSIAVLPFQNMSSDPEQEYFADGMVDDIIAGLARIKWLFVISRNSSFAYKAKPTDVRQIGRELGVRYVLEGSVRKAGDRIRIGAQLIDAETGAHVWVERFDEQLRDIFMLQDKISMNVVGTIEPTLRTAEIERVRRRRPSSLDAYDLLLRALPFAHSHMAEEAAIAIPMLKRALDLEPDYAAAHAPLALCYHSQFSRAGLREEDRMAAIHHARAAIEAGGDDAGALGIAGFVLSLDAHDHATALKVFEQALALSDSNHLALSSSALALSWMGTADIAIDRAKRAIRLSPLDPLNYLSCNALAISYLHLGQFEEAQEVAAQSVKLNSRFSVSRAFLTAALARLGRDQEAKAEAKEVLAIDPTFSVRRFSVTVDIEARVFQPIAEAWRMAGLPET